MIRKSIDGRNWTKNLRRFSELLLNKDFIFPLMELRHTLGLPKIKRIFTIADVLGDKPDKKEWENLIKLISVLATWREGFFEILSRENKNNLSEGVKRIIGNNKLSSEWKYPLVNFIIDGFFVPPIHNLEIESDASNGSLKLAVSSNTTLEDIKNAWDFIEKQKKKIFLRPSSKRNLSSKWADNFILAVRANQLLEKDSDLTSVDIVGRLSPNSDDDEQTLSDVDKKEANRLRQIKSRLKRRL